MCKAEELNIPKKDGESDILFTERESKMTQSPKFYWADANAIEEPHAGRYERYIYIIYLRKTSTVQSFIFIFFSL